FLLTLRRLPTSTLFPYTTLFRSSGERLTLNRALLFVQNFRRKLGIKLVRFCPPQFEHGIEIGERFSARFVNVARKPQSNRDRLRSEEHTSELQSRGHLVCRLLLE